MLSPHRSLRSKPCESTGLDGGCRRARVCKRGSIQDHFPIHSTLFHAHIISVVMSLLGLVNKAEQSPEHRLSTISKLRRLSPTSQPEKDDRRLKPPTTTWRPQCWLYGRVIFSVVLKSRPVSCYRIHALRHTSLLYAVICMWSSIYLYIYSRVDAYGYILYTGGYNTYASSSVSSVPASSVSPAAVPTTEDGYLPRWFPARLLHHGGTFRLSNTHADLP